MNHLLSGISEDKVSCDLSLMAKIFFEKINIAEPTTQRIKLGGREVDVRRLDLIHPDINGNKWYKLKYNLERVLREPHKTILTFGGPWSNHIYSTASAAHLLDIQSIGIIRGAEPMHWSETLKYAKSCGMQLVFISKTAYSEKETEDFRAWLHEEYGSFTLIPEGGADFFGVSGCIEILQPDDLTKYDIICCACGSGATAAGLLIGSGEEQEVVAFSAMKGGSFLKNEILKQVNKVFMNLEVTAGFDKKIRVVTDYHFGGFGKWNKELLDFMKDFQERYGIPLDQVYTGKMMYGLVDMIEKEKIDVNKRILVIHTGGLQGTKSLQNP
ncbi:MAG: 1-aminocyclopropane-1-carboxylate deaminase/D-cysteine desulfhydrase [Crocinitomicaceae bacterium]|nr:1-aminocyclopropane-1-carboxylate deaminase/D-cysteine desulfhydrase [Crocinitomicaceae bacterium]